MKREVIRIAGALAFAAILLLATASMSLAGPFRNKSSGGCSACANGQCGQPTAAAAPATYSNVVPCGCGCMQTGQCSCKNCCDRTADPNWRPTSFAGTGWFPSPETAVCGDMGYWEAGVFKRRWFAAYNSVCEWDGKSWSPAKAHVGAKPVAVAPLQSFGCPGGVCRPH